MSESKRVVSQRVSVVELSRRKSKRANDLLYDPDYYIDIKDVKLGPVLGKGAFSTVYGIYVYVLFINSTYFLD